MAESNKIQPQDPAQAKIERSEATDEQRTTGRKTMVYRVRRKLMARYRRKMGRKTMGRHL